MVQVGCLVTDALNVTAAGALMVTSNGLTQAATEEPTGRTITLYKLAAKLETVTGEVCPVCQQKTLTLIDIEKEIPYFGLVFMYSMRCENDTCKFFKADVEPAQPKDPCKIEFTVEKEADMKIRVVKAASATVRLGKILTMESTEMSNGYVSNIEGLLVRAKRVLEDVKETAEDEADKTQAKKHLKKLTDVMWGHDTLTITIEDPTGHSAIIDERATIKKLPKSKKN